MNDTKIIVFGSTGMLGKYVTTYFLSKKYDCKFFSRSDIDLSSDCSFEKVKNELKTYIDVHVNSRFVIINCASANSIKFFTVTEMLIINSLFPHFLENFKNTNSSCCINVVHITTDGVYSGTRGSYKESDYSDCIDIYGKTKSLGEPINITTLRTSIIGEERYTKHSFLEWVRSNKGNAIRGYTNHFWNGVTCLTLVKKIESIILKNNFWSGVRHCFTENSSRFTKEDLINLISKIYNLNVTTIPTTTFPINRTLSSLYDEGKINVSIEEQLIELKEFCLLNV